MKKTIKRVIIPAVALSVAIGMIMANFTGCQKKEPETIKIGAILPLTGPAAFYGEWGKKGMDIAVERVNSDGGINGKKVEILYGDSKNNPKEGISWMNKFSMENIPIVISAMTGVSFPLIPIAEKEQKVIFMTIVTHPEAADKSEWAFRHYINKGKAAQRMALFAREKLKLEKIGLLYINDEGGLGEKTAFKLKFEQLGGKIVGEESFEKTVSDVKGQLLKLSQLNPDAFYISGYGKIYGLAIKQAKELKLKQQLLASYEPLYKTTRELAGDAIEGTIFTSPYFEDDNPVAKKFKEEYSNKYGTSPEIDAGYGYDVINLIVYAIKRGGYSAKNIKDELLKVKNFEGTTGKINILPNGDCQTPIVIKAIRNGEIVVIEN